MKKKSRQSKREVQQSTAFQFTQTMPFPILPQQTTAPQTMQPPLTAQPQLPYGHISTGFSSTVELQHANSETLFSIFSPISSSYCPVPVINSTIYNVNSEAQSPTLSRNSYLHIDSLPSNIFNPITVNNSANPANSFALQYNPLQHPHDQKQQQQQQPPSNLDSLVFSSFIILVG
jgi:hypothetical protein